MKRLLFLFAFACVVLSCEKVNNSSESESESDINVISLTKAQEAFVTRGNELAFDILEMQNADSSFVIAPVNVEMMMGMMLNTNLSEDDLRAIFDFLGYGNVSVDDVNDYLCSLIGQLSHMTESVSFNTVSLCYVHPDVLTDSQAECLKNNYAAEVFISDKMEPSDRTLSWINDWIAANTNGAITPHWVADAFYSSALVYNLSSFNGLWRTAFGTSDTKLMAFHGLLGRETKVEMMSQDIRANYTKRTNYSAVGLPYGEGEFSMTLILPDEGKSLAEIKMTPDSWVDLCSSMVDANVSLRLPKFSVCTEGFLNQLITGINPDHNFPFNEEWYSVRISIAEEGTTASSMSYGGIVMDDAAVLDNEEFIADRPFMFVVSERSSGAILYVGQYCGD